MKQTDDNRKGADPLKLFSSRELEASIKNLSNPRFLGSIHLKREANPNFSSMDTLLNGELEMELNKSLKSTLFNPITKLLILGMIIFNLIWVIFLYIL